MNWFEKFIYTLQYEVEEPQVFGKFHITCVAIVAVLVAVVVMARKKISKNAINATMLTMGIVLLLSEILKQCIHSMDVVDGVAEWEYAWRTFPFQFCSVPMYLYIIAGILKKGRVYNTILCFLATYALFGGGVVMVYPSTVLSSTLFLSIHTMIWHGAILIIGAMLLATKAVELKFKTVLKACLIFVAVIIVAEAMNFTWHFFGDPDKTFSMLYISPYYKCDIPVLHDIKESAPYAVFLISYLVGFTLAACAVMGIAIGMNKLQQLTEDKKSVYTACL